jgi:hypothetical protein
MKLFKNIFITSALFLSSVTHSDLVTTNIFSDEVIDFEEFAIDGEISGPFQIGSTIGMDITIESSNPGNPLHIYDGGWWLCDNGDARGSKYAGLNGSSDTMIIKVNDGFVSAIGGVINYAKGCNTSPVVISAYDAAGNIIESHELPDFSTPDFTPKGLFFAIDTGENNIASFHISGGLANIIDDIVVSRASAPLTQPQQMISVNNTPKGVLGRTSVLEVAYATTNNNNQLSGLGIRVHFDSSLVSFNEITGLIEQDIIVDGQGPFSDDADFDNDPLTDQYMLFGWASLYNNWPNTELPTVLMNIAFDVSDAIDLDITTETSINFSDSALASGYQFESESYNLELVSTSWDFDGSGHADALTDGLMMLRYCFGLRGTFVTDSAMSPDSTMSSEQVVAEIESALTMADIDDDGEVGALTDGLMLLRYLFGLRGDQITASAVGTNANRTSNEAIEAYLEAYMPAM